MKREPNIGVLGLPGAWSSETLAQAVGKKTGRGRLYDASELTLDLSSKEVLCGGESLNSLDALVVKKIGAPYSPDLLNRLEILRFLEGRGVRIVNRPGAMLSLLNRLACTVTLASAGIPMPSTMVTESLAKAKEAVRRFGTAILKPLYTSKSRGMVWVRETPDMDEILQRFREENRIFYIQKAVSFGERDLGLLFLDGRYLCTYARMGRDEGGRSLGYAGFEPEPDVIKLAERAQKPFGLDFTCVDVALTGSGPMVFEVSAFGGFRGALEACDMDVADRLTSWVLTQVSGKERDCGT